jgi:large repetitive protein
MRHASGPHGFRRVLVTTTTLLLLTLVAGVALTGAAGASPLRRQVVPLATEGPQLPTTGALFGANGAQHDQDTQEGALNGFESMIGRKVAVKRQYALWDDVFPDDFDRWVRDRGTTLMLSWQSGSHEEVDAYWDDIAGGQYDSLIDARAADIKAYGAPLFFTFDHEPEMKTSGTSSEFISAWRHIHDRFVADGVTNVSWVLILLSYTYMNDGADAWYPGDGYVDLLGADGYNWFQCPPDVWKPFEELFDDFYAYGEAKAKKMVIAELGSIEDPDDPGAKAAWFTDATAVLKTMPDIKVVSYYNNGISGGALCDWWVDSSASSLAAYTAMGADSYFNPPPPLISVTGPPDPDNDATPTFTFSSNLPGTTYTCSTDGGTAKTCVSPYTTSSLANGVHTLAIIGTDPVSQLSNTALTTWTVDTARPTVTIESGPDDETSQTNAHFRMSSTEDGTFSCQLDGAPAETCANNIDYSDLADGDHVFVATATDLAGNVSTPATYPWTVDTVAPTATITDGPASLTNSKAPSFSFTSNESGSTFKCLLDDGNFLTCTSPKSYTNVTDGTHTFKVEAIDGANNIGSPIAYTWTVDSSKPVVNITSGPDANTKLTSASFGFTVTDDHGTTSTCKLDSGVPAPCGPGGGGGGSASDTFGRNLTDTWGTGDSGQSWKLPTDNPTSDFDVSGAVGTMVASVKDNPRLSYLPLVWSDQDELFRFSVDKKPTTSRVIAYAVGRYDSSSGAFYAVRVSVVWDGSVRLDASKKPVTGAETVLGTEVVYSGMGAANTWYWVRAHFGTENGNGRIQGKVWKDGTPEPTDWGYSYLDTSSPLTGSGRPALRAQAWSTEVPFVVSFDDFSAASGLNYSNLFDGSHTETITATDDAGNVGTATWNWTVDTVAPVATITSTPANPTNQTSATFKFSSNETGGTFTCRLDNGQTASCTSPTTYSGLGEGSHTFTLTATDKAGNASAPATSTWTVDITAPSAIIDSGPANPSKSKSATFTFHSEAGATFKCSLDGASFTTCMSGKTYWTLADGSHTVKVEAIDQAGNTGVPVPYTWTIDTVKPTVTITSGPADPTTQSTATFKFTASEGNVTFTCQLDAQAATTCVSGVTYTGITTGRHTFKVWATDLAGNVGVKTTWSWTKQ